MAIDIQVVFDAADPARLARFWALALDYQPQPPPEGFDSWDQFADKIGLPQEKRRDLGAIVDPDRTRPRLFFQRVPEGKMAKNRVHLDINASAGAPDPEEGWRRVIVHMERLIAAGATVQREMNEPIGRWMVMRDPEGNEFCIQ